MQSNLFILSIIASSTLALHVENLSSKDSYPMNCYTKQGDVCLFPAKDANGNEINQCYKSMCPISVNKDTLAAEEWAECDPSSCVIACMTETRQRCVFPFLFNENDDIYNRRCAKNDEGNFVCATEVDSVTRVGRQMETCNMNACPLD